MMPPDAIFPHRELQFRVLSPASSHGFSPVLIRGPSPMPSPSPGIPGQQQQFFPSNTRDHSQGFATTFPTSQRPGGSHNSIKMLFHSTHTWNMYILTHITITTLPSTRPQSRAPACPVREY
eukprot:UN16566